MDRLRDEYGKPVHQTDEYGNPVRQTDEYPVQNQYSASTMGAYDIGAIGADKYAGGTDAGVPGYDPGYGAPGVGTGTGTAYQGDRYDTGTGARYDMGLGAGTRTGTGETGMGTRTHGGSYDTGVVDMGGSQLQHQKQHESGLTGMLHRSGSSSSSSSEDDGQGGRRKKKGLKEKIKDKLPGGGRKKDEYGSTATTGIDPHGHSGYGQPEKKGIMEKIKDKLPGGH
ncbi:dehydrin DHN1-like [Chenopodium quinoa]|uniref:dehydrin DHN1-like n=1 Tax=Chenopodium quinoa TaxID=63459 RepID=UPI000B7952A3|nr:dehydrin DHN1-like [Chenopodium quinoa]